MIVITDGRKLAHGFAMGVYQLVKTYCDVYIYTQLTANEQRHVAVKIALRNQFWVEGKPDDYSTRMPCLLAQNWF